jgi:beta-glucosidase
LRYTEGAAVGYRWFDAKGHDPLFAFGHGLSYTNYAYTNFSAAASKESVAITFTVRNAGTRAGMDVPQIYVSGNGWEAPKRLGGWQKVTLQAGETKTLAVTVDPRLLAMFDVTNNNWKISAGTYRVMLGSSSKDIHETATVQLRAAMLPVGWHPAK